MSPLLTAFQMGGVEHPPVGLPVVLWAGLLQRLVVHLVVFLGEVARVPAVVLDSRQGSGRAGGAAGLLFGAGRHMLLGEKRAQILCRAASAPGVEQGAKV